MNRCHEHCHSCEPRLCKQALTCNLTGCKIAVISAEVSGDNLQLTVNPISPESCKDYLLDICIPLPPVNSVGTIIITDGTNTCSLSDTNGNPVPAGKLCGKSVYCVRYGNGGAAGTGTYPPHFTVKRRMCRDDYTPCC